jgi:hypothetical protein
MSEEVKKLTEEELQSIKNVRQEYTNLALAFGELELQKLNLLEAQKELVAKEAQLAQQLQEKYGQGTIDLNTGEVKA